MTVMPCCSLMLERVHDDLGVARIERGDRLVGEDDLRASASARGRWRRAAAGRLTACRPRCSAVCAISSRSSAAIASIRSSWVKMLSRLISVGRRLRRPSSTLVSTSRRGTRLNCWKIMAQSARQARSAAPLSAGHVAAVEMRSSRRRVGQAVDHAQQGRLAGAGAADDADHLALRECRGRRHRRRVLSPKRRVHLVDLQHRALPVRSTGSLDAYARHA